MQEKPTPTEELEQQRVTDPLATPPVIESDLAASDIVSTEPPAEPDISKHPTVPLAPLAQPKRYFQVNWWSVVALSLLLILIGEHTIPLVLPLVDGYLHPKAIVTLFPTQKTLNETYTFLAVTGTADQTRNQIPSRIISFITPTKTETIKTTGIGYTPAIQATGTITFYNEANYPQTIAAGTVITGNAIQIATDQTITISAGNPPNYYGIAETLAHTIQAGSRGNIPPLYMNGLCCLAGIYGKNTNPFTGGEDPKPYQMLSNADLQREATYIAGTLSTNANSGIQQQIRASEQLLQPMQCNLTTTSIPKVGERATTATVSVSETCTVQVYDNAILTQLTNTQFTQDSQKQLSSNFTQHGNLTIAIAKTTLLDKRHSTYKLEVSAAGMLIFHLSPSQLKNLKAQIAGKKIREAQHELLALTGVQGVSIQPARQSDLSLPANPDQIEMIISSALN